MQGNDRRDHKTLRSAQLVCALALTIQPLAALAALDVPSGRYVLDETHGYITFSYSHLGFSTPQLTFTDFDVSLQLDAKDPQNSALEVTIDANSIESHVEEFNEHLVGERLFDTARFPTITFTSTAIELHDDDTATITGDLVMKGQSHPVVLQARLNKAGEHPMLKKPVAGFDAQTTVLRSEWGLGYAVPMVSDEVNIRISVELQHAQ